MEQTESINTRMNQGVVMMKSALLLMILFSMTAANALEKRPPFHPIKMLCGTTDDNAKPFVVIDYETREVSKDLGQVGEMLPTTYDLDTYPFPNYRPISTGKERFRVATHVMTTPYKFGQFIAYMTIYEEDPDGKTLRKRAAHVIDAADLKATYQVQYKVPNSKRAVTCYANSPDLSKALVQAADKKKK